jgi:hypothetical protein
MDCLECKNLEETFDSRLSQYIEACSAAYYRVSTELAAKKNVGMERARNDLKEHQEICPLALLSETPETSDEELWVVPPVSPAR